ncbi:MAG TPA: superoxide dismutase family protein [Brevundimonas sp.]
MRALPLFAALAASSILGAGAALAQTTPAAPAAAPTPAPAPVPVAVATAALKTADGADAGTVTSFEGPKGMIFRIDGKGWPAGWHAVHLHAVGTCEGPAFTSAGGHVNHAEGARPHGLLNKSGGPDLGDLQNVYAAADGSVHADVYLAWEGLNAKPSDYIDANGLSFLVHASPDDYVSQPIGGAGARIACGVFQSAAHTGH